MALFQVDVSAQLAYVMAPKEESEVSTIKKACTATMDLFKKYLQDQLMEIIDADKVRCSQSFNWIVLCSTTSIGLKSVGEML